MHIGSQISIIIPISKQSKHIKGCLESITKNTSEPYEIILINRGAKGSILKWLREYCTNDPTCRLIESSKGRDTVERCNEGIKASCGENIVLLHNDIVLTEGCFSRMMECLNTSSNTGIVGPMTNSSHGLQKVTDAEDVTVEFLDEYANCFAEKNRYRRVLTRQVAGFCMLFQRDLIEKIGLLDENLGDYYYATEDFCLRAALEDHSSLIAGDVFVFSRSNDTPKGSKKKLKEVIIALETEKMIIQAKPADREPKTPEPKKGRK